MSSAETIRVVIRCKGGEVLSANEESRWLVNDTEITPTTGVAADGRPKGETITFDKVLLDVS